MPWHPLWPSLRNKMKVILKIVGGVLILFAIAAGFGSARDWLVLRNLSGYEKDHFTIMGTRVIQGTGDEGTHYYLQGRGRKGEYEFVISAARYEALSGAVGEEITVFRNSSMPAIALQRESVSVIFGDEWRDGKEVEVSAKSTMWIGVMAMLAGVSAFVFAKVRFTHQADGGERLKPVPGP